MSYFPLAPAVTRSKQVEIDFGPAGVMDGSFVIADANVTATSKLVGAIAYEAPTGKSLDELEFDNFDLMFTPGAGNFTLVARALDGPVAGTFKVNYSASAG
jgi:hypothetical protein